MATLSDITSIIKETGAIGLEVTDIAGDISTLTDISGRQVKFASSIQDSAQGLQSAYDKVFDHAQKMQTTIEDVGQQISEAYTGVSSSAEIISALASEVNRIVSEVTELQTALGKLNQFSDSINKITNQINMLSLNATIEAARAGEHGKGFAVVAHEVRVLSTQTESVNKQISGMVQQLTNKASYLVDACKNGEEKAVQTLSTTKIVHQQIESVTNSFAIAEQKTQAIYNEISGVAVQSNALSGNIAELNQGLEVTSKTLETSNGRIARVISSCESVLATSIEIGHNKDDEEMLKWCTAAGKKIAKSFEMAIEKNEIAFEDFFDAHYAPIKGSDPQQVIAKFTKITDKYVPEVTEPVLGMDPRIVFCAPVDVRGYLPTHNRKFSQLQGSDPVWNLANCRNRRIFDDRVGLAAGRNTKPFLLQMYRRDMGGGNFILMKDLSVPIHIKGRHWGGLRLAYKVQ